MEGTGEFSALERSERHKIPHLAETAADRRLAVFSSIWALAAIAHLLNVNAQGLEAPAGYLTLFAAIWLLHNPRSASRLAIFAALQVFEVIWIAPLVADHQLLMAVVNLALLQRLAADRIRGRRFVLSSGFSNTARILVMIAYIGAATAKYNSTFLDPITSCGTFLAKHGSLGLFDFGGPLRWLPVLFAVGSETFVALSLSHPRSRRYGVRYAIAFHFLLTASPAIAVEDFSLTLDALFVLFLTDRDIGQLLQSARRIADDIRVVVWLRLIRSDSLKTVFIFGGLVVLGLTQPFVASKLFWPLGAAIGVWLLINLARSFNHDDVQPVFSRPTFAAIATPLVMMLAVFSPYLGTRTLGVFTMFSNLRTAGPGTNHLFMPSWNLSGELDDLFVPLDGSSEQFDELIADGQAIQYFELRRMAEDDDLVAVGLRNGQPLDSRVDRLDPPSPILAKLFLFRAVPDTGEPLCTN